MKFRIDMMGKFVCSNCIETISVRSWVKNNGAPRVCSYCKRNKKYTVDMDKFNSYLLHCIEKFYGRAVDQLFYNSRAGGYQGKTYDTDEIIFGSYCLELKQNIFNALHTDIVYGIPDEPWCDFNYMIIDDDDAIRNDWGVFVEIIKKRRRFFFYSVEKNEDIDSYSIVDILERICCLFEKNNLIKKYSGCKLWRARPNLELNVRSDFLEYGPPLYQYSMQSNRMNPAGIPMMYLASSFYCAIKESRADKGYVGQWEIVKDLNILDLRGVLNIKTDLWSDQCSRNDILDGNILKDFVYSIMALVDRSDSVHVDYLPSQVACEFFRDYDFNGVKIDGIAYPSAVHKTGWNVALYVDVDDTVCEENKTMLSGKVKFIKAKKIMVI